MAQCMAIADSKYKLVISYIYEIVNLCDHLKTETEILHQYQEPVLLQLLSLKTLISRCENLVFSTYCDWGKILEARFGRPNLASSFTYSFCVSSSLVK
jgi:hypothetical protein